MVAFQPQANVEDNSVLAEIWFRNHRMSLWRPIIYPVTGQPRSSRRQRGDYLALITRLNREMIATQRKLALRCYEYLSFEVNCLKK